jgi:hypothetical protein
VATYTLAPTAKFQAWDNAGLFEPGAFLYTYVAGTSTPATTYRTDSGTAHTNPIVMDGSGRVPNGGLYLEPGQSYKFELQDVLGNVLWTQDGIAAVPFSSSNQDITGTAGENLTVNEVVYLSDGSGGLIAGRWYKGDADNAYSSTKPLVGFALGSIGVGTNGSIRLGGDLASTALTPGADYYISATAGAITAVAPSNARYVGVAQSTTSLLIAANPPPSPMVLLKANSGTTTSAAAENVDTIAISGLTAKDTIKIVFSWASATQDTANPRFYQSTDGVNVLQQGTSTTVAAGTGVVGEAFVRQAQTAATTVHALLTAMTLNGATRDNANSQTYTQNWTGSWTLAIRHDGVTAGGTFSWSWAVYRVRGQ